jgi:hypothetical protein
MQRRSEFRVVGQALVSTRSLLPAIESLVVLPGGNSFSGIWLGLRTNPIDQIEHRGTLTGHFLGRRRIDSVSGVNNLKMNLGTLGQVHRLHGAKNAAFKNCVELVAHASIIFQLGQYAIFFAFDEVKRQRRVRLIRSPRGRRGHFVS